METLGALMKSKKTLKLIQDDSTRASFLGIPVYTLGDDRIRIIDNIYQLTPEIYKALLSTSYTGKPMKNDNDILMMNNIRRDLGYIRLGDRKSNRKLLTFSTITLPKLVEENKKKQLRK